MDKPFQLNSFIDDGYQLKAIAADMVPPATSRASECQGKSTRLDNIAKDTDPCFKPVEQTDFCLVGADLPFPSASVNINVDAPTLPSWNRQHAEDVVSTREYFSPLGAVASLPSLTIMNDEERLMKLTRINDLLVEAAQLQSEVFC